MLGKDKAEKQPDRGRNESEDDQAGSKGGEADKTNMVEDDGDNSRPAGTMDYDEVDENETFGSNR